ncbi:hypothetical protein RyT2_24380 [Pseudolactococcus yaeyamensis]
MLNLFEFEYLRFKNNRVLFLLPILLIVIGFSGVLLTQIYTDGSISSYLTLFNIYNAYAQFVFLFISFIYIYSFSEDFSKGSYAFYRQIGYSLRKCLFVKLVLLYIPTALIVTFFIVLSALKFQIHEILKIVIAVITINFGLLFCIVFSLFLSLLLKKKTMFAAVTNFIIYIACNILNLVLLGLTNPLDGNSLSTSMVKYLFLGNISNQSIVRTHWNFETQNFLFAVMPSIVYVLIFGIIIYIYSGRKNYET